LERILQRILIKSQMEMRHWKRHTGKESESPCLPRVSHPPSTFICSATWQSLNPIVLGLLWRLYHTGIIDYELNLQPLSPSQRMRVGLKVPSF
jgi:hypothetical protein